MQGDAWHPLQPILSPRQGRFSIIEDVHQCFADYMPFCIELALFRSTHNPGVGGVVAGKSLGDSFPACVAQFDGLGYQFHTASCKQTKTLDDLG
jgi:hypothetical protein